jgi:NAD(P)-dependent dehydrogenase (short-subunit alcohol dehydrogenase family)
MSLKAYCRTITARYQIPPASLPRGFKSACMAAKHGLLRLTKAAALDAAEHSITSA